MNNNSNMIDVNDLSDMLNNIDTLPIMAQPTEEIKEMVHTYTRTLDRQFFFVTKSGSISVIRIRQDVNFKREQLVGHTKARKIDGKEVMAPVFTNKKENHTTFTLLDVQKVNNLKEAVKVAVDNHFTHDTLLNIECYVGNEEVAAMIKAVPAFPITRAYNLFTTVNGETVRLEKPKACKKIWGHLRMQGIEKVTPDLKNTIIEAVKLLKYLNGASGLEAARLMKEYETASGAKKAAITRKLNKLNN